MEIKPDRVLRVPDSPSTQVGKILCIGRNYARHAAEMASPVPKTPMVFLKPSSAIIRSGDSIEIPAGIGAVHHEVELVAMVGRRARDVPEEDAASVVACYAVGLDMTARDVQAEAKRRGAPWSVAKGFDTFAPLGHLVSSVEVEPSGLNIRLSINGNVVQDGNTRDMVFSVAQLVAYCSTVFTLEPGDLIYTGTPEGVGPVVPGDHLHAEIDGLPPLEVAVVSR